VRGNLGFPARELHKGRGVRGNLGFLQENFAKEGACGETLVSCKRTSQRKGRAGKPWFPAEN